MANFVASAFSFSEINGGRRYENGDIPTAEAINKPIEASYWAQEMANSAQQKADEAINKVNDSAHGEVSLSAWPIGSIYMSLSSTSPAQLFGGTWERITQKFLFAADGGSGYGAGTTGGQYSHSHNLSTAYALVTSSGNAIYFSPMDQSFQSTVGCVLQSNSVSGTWGNSTATRLGGNTETVSNMPPYLAVYMWKRIS